MEKIFFQDHMPNNVCFGCGTKEHNPDGLHIKSYWDGEESVCNWQSKKHLHGFQNIMNGGILATIIDCHCMGTAMADAYKREGRGVDSFPIYFYATGSFSLKYLKPTPNNKPVELRAKVVETKGRKTVLTCAVFSEGIKTVEADIVAILVYDSSKETEKKNVFAHR